MSKQEAIRARVVHFYKSFASWSKIETVRHFMAEGISKGTIYNILSMLESRSTIERKKGSGKRPTKLTPEVLADLKSNKVTVRVCSTIFSNIFLGLELKDLEKACLKVPAPHSLKYRIKLTLYTQFPHTF